VLLHENKQAFELTRLDIQRFGFALRVGQDFRLLSLQGRSGSIMENLIAYVSESRQMIPESSLAPQPKEGTSTIRDRDSEPAVCKSDIASAF
jgi:hypothetical protein